jgi:hypothetical protein
LSSKKKISTKVICSINDLIELEKDWNSFIREKTSNPFLLSNFFVKFLEHNLKEGWSPLIIIFSKDQIMIGVAPLVIKTLFGMRIAKFALPPSYFPDIIIDSQYQDVCLNVTCDILFKRLNCQIIELILPVESPNTIKMKNLPCSRFSLLPERGHSFLLIDRDWLQFEKKLNKKHRQTQRRTIKLLNSTNDWQTRFFDGIHGREAFGQILEVEQSSWKREWRTKNKINADPFLPIVFEGVQETMQYEKDLNSSIWVLEVNSRPIAYVLVVKYKEFFYITKTSYNKDYKIFYPGLFIMNIALSELFKEGQTKKIDFLTSLPFMKNWNVTDLPRVRFSIGKTEFFPLLLEVFVSKKPLKSFLLFLAPIIPFFNDIV